MHRFLPALLLLLTALTAPAQDVLRVIAMPTKAQCEEAGVGQPVAIDKDLLHVWRKHRDEALEEGATIIVLEITTPGGELKTTGKFLDDLKNLRDMRGVRTVAYVPEDATSAGAMIAIGCRELIMGVGAGIGNAIPIEFHGTGSFELAPEKLTTQWANKIATIGEQGGFDGQLIRSMVDKNMEIVLIVSPSGDKGLFLTREELKAQYPPEVRSQAGWRGPFDVVPNSQALKYFQGLGGVFMRPQFLDAFPHQVARSRDDLPRLLGLGDRPLRSEELMEMPPPKGLGYFFHLFGQLDWTLLLLVAGIGFFIMELKTPGLGVFGVVGILCLVGYFALQQGEGMPLAFTIGMLILGFFLLLAEFFIIPGFGVAGVAGLIMIFFSVYAATVGLEGETISEQLIPNSDHDWIIVQAWLTMFLGSTVAASMGALTFAKTLHRIPLLNRAFVKPPVLDPVRGMGVSATGQVKVEIGARGTADTDLRPSGHVTFSQGALDVVSEGGFIRRGAAVEVTMVEGHRVVVAEVSAPPGAVASDPALPAPATPPETTP